MLAGVLRFLSGRILFVRLPRIFRVLPGRVLLVLLAGVLRALLGRLLLLRLRIGILLQPLGLVPQPLLRIDIPRGLLGRVLLLRLRLFRRFLDYILLLQLVRRLRGSWRLLGRLLLLLRLWHSERGRRLGRILIFMLLRLGVSCKRLGRARLRLRVLQRRFGRVLLSLLLRIRVVRLWLRRGVRVRLWQLGWEWQRRSLGWMCLRGKSHKSQLRRTGCAQQIILKTDLSCCFVPGGTPLFRKTSACCPTPGGRKTQNSQGEQKSWDANAMAMSPQRGTT